MAGDVLFGDGEADYDRLRSFLRAHWLALTYPHRPAEYDLQEYCVRGFVQKPKAHLNISERINLNVVRMCRCKIQAIEPRTEVRH